LRPLFKRAVKNPKTEHLKTDYSFHNKETGLYVPIVATLERKRNKAMLNTFASNELDRTAQLVSEVKDLSKRQTQKSFQFINNAHHPTTAGVRVRTRSSNDQHEDQSFRRKFLEVSPEHNDKRVARVFNT